MSLQATREEGLEAVRWLVPGALVLAFAFGAIIGLYGQVAVLVLASGLVMSALGLYLLRAPWIGILLIAVLGPLNDLQRLPFAPGINGVKLIGALTILAWLPTLVSQRRRIVLTRVGIFYLLLIILLLIATLTSRFVAGGLAVWMTVASYFMIYLVVVETIDSEWRLLVVLRGLVVVSGLVGALALLQYITSSPIFSSLLFYDSASEVSDLRLGPSQVVRVVGTAADPNAGALVPLLALPLAAALLMREKTRIWAITLAVCSGLMGVHLLLSLSRSAWLGILAVIPLFLGRRTLPGRRVIWIALVALVMLVAGPIDAPVDAIRERVDQTVRAIDAQAERNRWALYRAIPSFVRDHGVFGVGLGTENFTTEFYRYSGVEITPHSSYLGVLGAGGVFALALYLAIFTEVIRQWRARPKTPLPYRIHVLRLGIFASLMALQVRGLFNTGHMWVMSWLLLGLWSAYRRNIEEIEA